MVELAGLSLWPLIEERGVDDDLAVGRQLHVGAVHGARGRPFEVDALAVIAAAVAWTLELVLARFPVRRTTEVRAARVDHEDAVRCAIDPDAVFLLKLGIDPESELRGIANLENGVRLEQSAGKKESEEGEEPCSQERCHGDPYQPPPPPVDISVRRARRGKSSRCCRLRRSHGWRAYVLPRIHRARGCGLRRFWIRGRLAALRLRHTSSSC